MPLATEVAKLHAYRLSSGFYQKYMSGVGLDIGYAGMQGGCEPVLPNATGIDLHTPGYDGIHLPYGSETQDFVFTSHCLEHMLQPIPAIQEWARVVRVGGYLIMAVPHCYLYERSFSIPGAWDSCKDHKRVYTPARLLGEIEQALVPNTYRIESLRDNDQNFNYGIAHNDPGDLHKACFEIELVLRKINPPNWSVA